MQLCTTNVPQLDVDTVGAALAEKENGHRTSLAMERTKGKNIQERLKERPNFKRSEDRCRCHTPTRLAIPLAVSPLDAGRRRGERHGVVFRERSKRWTSVHSAVAQSAY